MLFKKKNKTNFVKWGITAGFLECLYILLVILLLNGLDLAGKNVDNFLSGSLFMLLLFVFSVLISGVLVLGKPILLILRKKISEAISTFFVTLVTVFVIFVIVSIIIFA